MVGYQMADALTTLAPGPLHRHPGGAPATGGMDMWNWLSRPRRVQHEVVMYTRHGCHLCEEAWETLLATQQRFDFALRKVDVDTDAGLGAEFGTEVPVVTFDGQVRFRGRVNIVLLH